MKIAHILKKDIVIGRNTEGLFRYFGWSSVIADEKGTLCTAVSNRPTHIDPFGRTLIYKSFDNGETWTEGKVIFDDHMDDRDSGLLYLGEGRMLLTGFTHAVERYFPEDDQHKDWSDWQKTVTADLLLKYQAMWKNLPEDEKQGKNYILFSDDYGETWSNLVRTSVTSPHGPIRLQDGTLFYLGRGVYPMDKDLPMEEGIYAFVSHDEGKTWEKRSKITDYGFKFDLACEPYALQLKNGDILGTIRIHNGPTAPDSHAFSIGFCRSTDNGNTWTQVKDGGFEGSPPHLVEAEDGTVILVYGKRRNPMGEFVRFSEDGGNTFGEAQCLSDVTPETRRDVGYPCTVACADGTFLTVYYQPYGKDFTPSLLATKWRMDEA